MGISRKGGELMTRRILALLALVLVMAVMLVTAPASFARAASISTCYIPALCEDDQGQDNNDQGEDQQ